CARLKQRENLFLGVVIHLIFYFHDNTRGVCKDLICVFFLLFRYLTLLFGAPAEPPCEQGQDAHSDERNISNPGHRRSFALRLLGFVQGLLSLLLGRSHRLKLLALGARSRLRLQVARTDEVEMQGCGLRRTLWPTRHPGLCLSYVVA